MTDLCTDVARLLSGLQIQAPEPEEWPLSAEDRIRGAMFAGHLRDARHERFRPEEVCSHHGAECVKYRYHDRWLPLCERCRWWGAALDLAKRLNGEQP